MNNDLLNTITSTYTHTQHSFPPPPSPPLSLPPSLPPSLSPLPERPTNRRSLKRATWFLKVAMAFRSSAAEFSSFPAVRITLVPSAISESERTLKGTGRVLLQRQCDGSIVHTKLGLSVVTSSPGYSASSSEKVLSPRYRLDDGGGRGPSGGGGAIASDDIISGIRTEW